MAASAQTTLDFNSFADDLLLEILSALPVQDVIRYRRVCKRLQGLTHERALWVDLYRNSTNLLLPAPLGTQSSDMLEKMIVRATRLHAKWTSVSPQTSVSRVFLTDCESYEYDACLMSGRYLMVASRNELKWYDLEAKHQEPPSSILVFDATPYRMMAGLKGLSYQENANNEGENIFYVAFVGWPNTVILKLSFLISNPTATVVGEIPTKQSLSMKLAHDFILQFGEFESADDPMVLYHIPSRQIFHLPMHTKIHHLSDLNYMQYLITPGHILLIFSPISKRCGYAEVFQLPNISLVPSQAIRRLTRSHTTVFPFTAEYLQVLDICAVQDQPSTETVTLLALTYVGPHPVPHGHVAQTGVQLFQVQISNPGVISVEALSGITMEFPITTGRLFSASASGTCLAVSHSSYPTSITFAYHIRYNKYTSAAASITATPLLLPDVVSRALLIGFDGLHGRLAFEQQMEIGVIDFVC